MKNPNGHKGAGAGTRRQLAVFVGMAFLVVAAGWVLVANLIEQVRTSASERVAGEANNALRMRTRDLLRLTAASLSEAVRHDLLERDLTRLEHTLRALAAERNVKRAAVADEIGIIVSATVPEMKSRSARDFFAGSWPPPDAVSFHPAPKDEVVVTAPVRDSGKRIGTLLLVYREESFVVK